MSRYIGADALKMDLHSIIKADYGYTTDVLAGLMIAERAIDSAPAVDAVEVVRCRDGICARKNAIMLDRNEVGLKATGADDFCSRGERRTDE